MEKNKFRRRDKAAAAYGFISMATCIAILICSALAWFSFNRVSDGGGISLETIDTYAIKISHIQGGADVSTFQTPGNLFPIAFDSGIDSASPGSSGSFSFCITVLSDDRTGGSLSFTPSIVPGGYNNAGEQTDGFRTGYDEITAADGINFLQGHIMVFTGFENGIYSGWLDPFDGTPVSFTSGSEITLYWVWTDYYYKLYTDDLQIAAADLENIRGHYMVDDDPLQPTQQAYLNLLDRRGASSEDLSLTKLSHFYDFADECIGKYIYHFSIAVQFSSLNVN